MDDGLEKMLLEELMCPVCDNVMHPPICQCQNGCSMCHECFSKVKKCPKCRGLKNPTSRNYALEAIHSKLNVPCKYAFTGCDFVSLGKDIIKHQTYCKFTPKSCPFKHYDNCDWKDVNSKLQAHLNKKHPSNFYIREKQRFMAQNFTTINTYYYIYAVIFAFNEFFRVTWDLDPVTGLTRWAVFYMGSPEQAKKYAFKLEFPHGDSTCWKASFPLIWKSECQAAPEKECVKFVDHKCLYLHRSLLDGFCEENGQLNYRITVYDLVGEDDSSTACSTACRPSCKTEEDWES